MKFRRAGQLAKGELGGRTVRKVMEVISPCSCTPETELDQVRPMMLSRHTRYMPVMDNRMLMGVISFYDVAKAVVDSQNFENKMLKAYIRDWPKEDDTDAADEPARQGLTPLGGKRGVPRQRFDAHEAVAVPVWDNPHP